MPPADAQGDGSGLEMLEGQQARLVKALRRADGAAVTYDDLRARGIEFPASVVSELELAGVPVERCQATTAGRRQVVGVRLDPAKDPWRVREQAEDAATPTGPAATEPVRPPGVDGRQLPTWVGSVRESARAVWASLAAWVGSIRESARAVWASLPAWMAAARKSVHAAVAMTSAWMASTGRSVWRRSARARVAVARWRAAAGDARVPSVDRRWLGPAALLATGIAVLVVVLPGLVSGAGGVRHTVRHHRATRPTPSIAPRLLARAPRSTPSAQPAPPPVSLPLATQLESQGHGLLEAGQYANAVPVLRRAVSATGEHLAGCVEPASESCLIYAYALYDLGRALRLEGQVSAAVPILEQRLQIDNQRGAVQAELQLAENEAGSSVSTGSSASTGASPGATG